MSDTLLMSVTEAARLSGISRATIYRDIENQRAPWVRPLVLRVGGRWKVSRYQLDLLGRGEYAPSV